MTPRLTLLSQYAVQFAVFLFGMLCISVPSGYSVGFFLLLLLALPRLVFPSYWRHTRREGWWLIGIFMLYFVSQAIPIYLDHGILKHFDRPSRLLMLACMVPLLCQFRPSMPVLQSGLTTGAILGGLLACYERVILELPRAFDNIMPIQAGDISLTLGLIALCSACWHLHQHQYRWACFHLGGFGFGVIGSLLSGSRGGWLLLPMVLLLLLFRLRRWLPKHTLLTLVALLGLLGGLACLPQVGVTERLAEARSDLTHYENQTNPNTSLGFRLQFWQSAWHSFLDKPVFGWGPKSIRISQEQQYRAGTLSKEAFDFNSHAHNQYLDQMAKFGLFGLICLLLLFLVPWYLAIRLMNQANDTSAYLAAICTELHILSTLGYCLSQVFLGHNSGVIVYPFLMLVLLMAAMPGSHAEQADTLHD